MTIKVHPKTPKPHPEFCLKIIKINSCDGLPIVLNSIQQRRFAGDAIFSFLGRQAGSSFVIII